MHESDETRRGTVNCGPGSLDVLRFVADLGDRARTVLGNHDLHLVATACGVRKLRRKDTFHDVLEAADSDALIDWLRTWPIMHRDREKEAVLVHAGIAPAWSIDYALACAPDLLRFLSNMYGNDPVVWADSLAGFDRLRFITNAFTRMRYCHADGRLHFSGDCPPGEQDPSLVPWFTLRSRDADRTRIVFGHWATPQIRARLSRDLHVRHVDTGCIWGGSLTALRLDDDREYRVACNSAARPNAR